MLYSKRNEWQAFKLTYTLNDKLNFISHFKCLSKDPLYTPWCDVMRCDVMRNDDDSSWKKSYLHFCIMNVKKNQMTILEEIEQHDAKLQHSNINKIPQLKILISFLDVRIYSDSLPTLKYNCKKDIMTHSHKLIHSTFLLEIILKYNVSLHSFKNIA